MTTAEAARLLDLPADSTPEQLETRFLELRRKLEEKIAKAPTPGLQAKYRETLATITTAFETLTLAADSSTLPLLRRDLPVATAASARPQPTPEMTDLASARKPVPSKTNREFAIVALIAVLLLGGGGWWVMKTRADNEEKSRMVTIAKAEADLKVAKAERAAILEAERKAAEAERKAAEAERVAKLTSRIGARLAEARVEWEAYESNLTDAERLVAELKSEAREQDRNDILGKAERSARLASHLYFSEWLKTYLLRHPAKMARARGEQLLLARAVDEAQIASDELTAALSQIGHEVELRRKYLFQTKGTVRIESKPDGLNWTLVDAYGRKSHGVTPAEVAGLPLTHVSRELLIPDGTTKSLLKLGEHTTGKVSLTFSRLGWEDVTVEAILSDHEPKVLEFGPYPEGSFEVTSVPSGMPWEAKNKWGWKVAGITPALIKGVPPGTLFFTASRPGYASATESLILNPNESRPLSLDLLGQTMKITVEEKEAEIWVAGKMKGSGSVTLEDLPIGDRQIELRLKGHKNFTTLLAVKEGVKSASHSFSFQELTMQKHRCVSCEGKGVFARSGKCESCAGHGTQECSECHGSGTVTNLAAVFANSLAEGLNAQHKKQQEKFTCGICNGRGSVTCRYNGCNRGIFNWNEKCGKCGGDGLQSLLDLSR